VTYWRRGRTVQRTDSWDRLPREGVLGVRISDGDRSHLLVGADGYWIDGDTYGVTYEDAVPRFGGIPFASWGWGREHYDLGVAPPPEGVAVLRGIEIPDDVWREVRQWL
jgi:hypothetical protein